MADQIKLTLSEINKVSTLFIRNSGEITSMLNTLKSAKIFLCTGWIGNSSLSFSYEFDNLVPQVQQFATAINQMGQKLKNAGKAMQQADDSKYFDYKALLTPGSLYWDAIGIKAVSDAYGKAEGQLFNYIKGKGLYLERRGNNFIVHGSHAEKEAIGIKAGTTKFSADKASNYEKYAVLSPETKTLSEQVGESFHLTKGTGILNAVGIAVDVGYDSYKDFNNPNLQGVDKANHIAADAVVDTTFDVGSIAASTAAGAIIGTFIPVPVVGTLAGAAAGLVVGVGINVFTNAWKPFEGGTKSISDEAKAGVVSALDGAEKETQSVGSSVSKGVSQASKKVSDFVGEGISDVGNSSIGKAISAIF